MNTSFECIPVKSSEQVAVRFDSPLRLKGCDFYKVSFEQFREDCHKLEASGALWFGDDNAIRKFYDDIQLPRRATKGSSGYDFFMPFPASFITGAPVMIPTGIRIVMNPGTWLMCIPRSGLGFKYGMRLRNTCGDVDEDYAFSDNEGHIMAKITTEEPFKLDKGDRFMQGIILPYFITESDDADGIRNGGFGSTGGEG